tara:strand:+ start:1333 stop:2787 length:1455 start_codon:yes stop_codon:yes gene_type:complete
MIAANRIKFSLIAAVTNNYGLGFKNGLPWKKFPVDMKWFQETTTGHTVIMGRKTWESLPKTFRPLPNRRNFVLTSNFDNSDQEGAHFFPSLDDALNNIGDQKAFIIGGGRLYKEALDHPGCEKLFITHANIRLPVDTFLERPNADKFHLAKVHKKGFKGKLTPLDSDEPVEVPYEMAEYVRTDPYVHPSTTYLGEAGYLKALQHIIEHGEERGDRTGVGTKALFGLQFRYNLMRGYPLLTTKKMFTKGIWGELLWFLKGQTDNNVLREQGIHIWDGNSTREFLDQRGLSNYPEWDIGPSYGFQFRHAGLPYKDCHTNYFEMEGESKFDQVLYVLDQLKNNPHGRRAIINLWNPGDLNKMALPPCLFMYQFWVSEDKYLHCSLYQRSGDMGLGVPFNIASASLLMNILGKLSGLIPRELVHHIGDAHIYMDHIEPLKRQIGRTPMPFPILEIQDRNQTCVEDFEISDFKVKGYNPYPGIKMAMAI